MTIATADTRSPRPVRRPRPITVTVGMDGGADFRGADDKVIQAALDYTARLGGGTVQVLPGEYTFFNALFPPSGATLRGSGEQTILKKAPGVEMRVTRPADWYEYAVEVEDAAAFRVGGGLALRSDNIRFPQTRLYTITAIEGGLLYLDRRTEANYWLKENATAAAVHSLIHGWDVSRVTVEDLVLDGNSALNPNLNGNYGGGVFLQYCNRWRFRNVTSRNYNGDGFSFQVCDDIVFEHCRALDNANLGFHPGSGSQRPVFFDCESRGNDVGLFWCWGVCDGRAERCRLIGNRKFGTSVGHRDTDNLLLACAIEDNGEVGVLFRPEPEPSWTADRNTLERCRIRDNGRCGVDIRCSASGVRIVACEFESGGAKRQPVAVRIGEQVGEVDLTDNVFRGPARAVEDLRPAR
ncbi:MAG: hypothetical protein GXP31_12965 [Kiritimatiellaeota bacterium]|nr:hypothetical protein [Kiritimatiellota bacterium]